MQTKEKDPRSVSLRRWIVKTSSAFLLLIVTALFIQATSAGKDEWVKGVTVDNVDCYYQLTTCQGQTVVYLKFDNRNNFPVNISWTEDFVTQEVRSKTQGFRGTKSLLLKKGVTMSSECNNPSVKECVVLSNEVNPVYNAKILEFSYGLVKVNKAAN